MRAQLRKAIPAILALFTLNAAAVTRYVDLNSPSPTPPYTNWPTAATNIQDAIDAADPGDEVLVTNGVYQTGGRVVFGAMTNRVAITMAVTVRSVNGSAVTTIQGGSTNGDSAVRCVYVTNEAVLAGFTLSSGHTRTNGDVVNERMGGGAWCELGGIVTNCLIISNSAASSGGGAYGGTLYDCVLDRNGASYGGGAYLSTIYNSLIVSNAAFRGGGVNGGTLYDCVVAGNSSGEGGGAYQSKLYDCNVVSNKCGTGIGGGTSQSVLSNCLVARNWAYTYGGGVYQSTNFNCVLNNNSNFYGSEGANLSEFHDSLIVGNHVGSSALFNCTLRSNTSPAVSSTLYNCTVTKNSGGLGHCNLYNCTVVSNSASAVVGGRIYNSILYYNTANWSSGTGSTFTNCCTTPLPSGSSNFTNAPLFVNLATGDLRLQSNSPGINDGNNTYVATDTDFDGNPRIIGHAVDVGAYENQSPASVLPHLWLRQFGLATDGSADLADTDGDGINNWKEWRSGTIPTNAASALRMLSVTKYGSGLWVGWQSVSTRKYFLERAANFGDVPPFQTIATNIPGLSVMQFYTDTSATNGGPYFYRVGVQ